MHSLLNLGGNFSQRTSMLHTFVDSFLKEEDGQDLVEYSLLLAFIGLAATAVLSQVSTNINQLWTKVNQSLTTTKNAITN